jgi:hypothetical protein
MRAAMLTATALKLNLRPGLAMQIHADRTSTFRLPLDDRMALRCPLVSASLLSLHLELLIEQATETDSSEQYRLRRSLTNGDLHGKTYQHIFHHGALANRRYFCHNALATNENRINTITTDSNVRALFTVASPLEERMRRKGHLKVSGAASACAA